MNQGNQAAVANFTLIRARSNFELMLGDAALEGQDVTGVGKRFPGGQQHPSIHGDYDGAITGYSQLLADIPSFTALHMTIGDAHRSKGDFETALASYEQLLGDPEHGRQAEVEMRPDAARDG